MGKLLEFATATEKPLRSRFGKWMLEVSKAVDALVAGTVNVQSLLLPEQSSAPAAVPNAGVVFTLDVNGITELFFREDNGTVVQITSNGQTLAYLTQSSWFVNSSTGSDTNDGATAATPIKTLAELERRWNGRSFAPTVTAVTVTLTGSFQTEPLNLVATFTSPTATIVEVTGSTTTVASGSVTAYTGFTPSTNTRAQLTDGAQNFTAHVRRRIRMTSGAANTAVTYICSLGGGITVANVGQFRTPPTTSLISTGASVNPGIGDTYVVETLDTQIREYNINCPGALVRLKSIEVSPVGGTTLSTCKSHQASSINLLFWGGAIVKTATLTIAEGSHTWIGSSLRGTGSIEVRDSASIHRNMCFFNNIQYHFGAFVQGGENVHDGNGTDNVTLVIEFGSELSENQHRGFFGCINGGTFTTLAHLSNASQWTMITASSLFWGAAGNTSTNAIDVENGSGMSYVTKPTATGVAPGADVVLAGGAAIAWAAVPAIAVAPDNAYVNVKH
jgi:hypothetical protein